MPAIQEARRNLSFAAAIDEGLYMSMRENPGIFVMGIGLTESPLIYSTLKTAASLYPKRVLNTPISEDALTGFALGASIGGKIPVTVHMRVDFMLLCMNQLINVIAPYAYATGKDTPMVFRVIIGRGWGQGYQHSKSLISTFCHIPGLTVVAPVTPSDAKGIMITALQWSKPVIFIEHRWLYFAEDHVPVANYTTPFDSKLLRPGTDATILAYSWMVVEALKVAEIMAKYGVSVGVVDVCNLSSPSFGWIKKWTRHQKVNIIADYDWGHCGLGAELASSILGAIRIAWPDTHIPTSREQENKFYPNALTIIRAIEQGLKLPKANLSDEDFYSWENKFKGPF